MKANIGSTDKAVRILLAALLITLVIAKIISGTVGVVLVVVAAVLLITALINFCPIWYSLGISTKKENNQNNNKIKVENGTRN